jgi:hypothetical protein
LRAQANAAAAGADYSAFDIQSLVNTDFGNGLVYGK